MKTLKQKFIIGSVFLIALLTAQTASAWYDPSTGRWLSRDPVGERGFQLTQRIRTTTTPVATRWISRTPVAQKEAQNLYLFVLNNPVGFYDSDGLKVQICCRDVNDSPTANCLAKICGKRHCFLKTDTKQAGMGPANPPSGGGLPSCPCGTDTMVTDHSKETGATCYDIPGADENCVNNELIIGKPLGKWGPNNNCNTFAGQVVKKCGGQNVCLQWTTVCGPDFGCMDVCTQWAY